jgi:hypothetical protein
MSSPESLTAAKRVSGYVREFRRMREHQFLGHGAFGTVTLVEDDLTHELIGVKAFDQQNADPDISSVLFLIHAKRPCATSIAGYVLITSRAKIGTRFTVNGSLKDALSFLGDIPVALIVCGLSLG